eukprot:TRINITY_DN7231_c0_g1_i1.p1 TRINITY_DN7231_c0_g1~~TRINITY_DN7231_c0_g1_i1.p1  ORF type:complete len:575 (+),score=189.61 TRINITY_DN7231_c0_g1_i1:78-1727(+)
MGSCGSSAAAAPRPAAAPSAAPRAAPPPPPRQQPPPPATAPAGAARPAAADAPAVASPETARTDEAFTKTEPQLFAPAPAGSPKGSQTHSSPRHSEGAAASATAGERTQYLIRTLRRSVRNFARNQQLQTPQQTDLAVPAPPPALDSDFASFFAASIRSRPLAQAEAQDLAASVKRPASPEQGAKWFHEAPSGPSEVAAEAPEDEEAGSDWAGSPAGHAAAGAADSADESDEGTADEAESPPSPEGRESPAPAPAAAEEALCAAPRHADPSAAGAAARLALLVRRVTTGLRALHQLEQSTRDYKPRQKVAWEKLTAHRSAPEEAVRAGFEEAVRVLSEFQYNLEGSRGTFIDPTTCKQLPLPAVLEIADVILDSGSKIQCVEATFVGLRLTQQLQGLQRFGLSFTASGAPRPGKDADPAAVEAARKRRGREFKHLVLGVHGAGHWGTLGISRCPRLMTKPLEFKSLVSLIVDFRKAWEEEGLKLLSVKLGARVKHQHDAPLDWAFLEVDMRKGTAEDRKQQRLMLEVFDQAMRMAAAEGYPDAPSEAVT